MNFILPHNKPAINNTDYINKLLKNVYILKIHQLCKKTFYALFVLKFYFKFMSTEHAQENQYHCCDIICCCLSEILLIKLLRMHNVSNLVFYTDIETFGYYEGELNLCTLYH